MSWARRSIIFAALSLPIALAQTLSFAQTWPAHPIRLVVAYPAGGGLDLVARAYGARLSELLKQPVIVDNRGGASGAIGADAVAKAKPDGYTLLMASPAEVLVGPIAGQRTPYNPVTDFAPVALAGETPLGIVAHPSVAPGDLQDFIARAKNAGEVPYGTPGTGSSMHFAGEAFKAGTGVNLLHVPYRGAAPAINDALGNQIGLVVVGVPPVVPHAKAGRLKILAVTMPRRSPLMPDVPAVAELPGLQDYRFSNWMAVFAPAKTPPAIVERLGTAIAEIAQEPAVREKLAGVGVDAAGLHGADFANFLSSERDRYKAIQKRTGIRLQE
jgi:tripartite-type tricarboxylate transporter receptor subunit TctC